MQGANIVTIIKELLATYGMDRNYHRKFIEIPIGGPYTNTGVTFYDIMQNDDELSMIDYFTFVFYKDNDDEYNERVKMLVFNQYDHYPEIRLQVCKSLDGNHSLMLMRIVKKDEEDYIGSRISGPLSVMFKSYDFKVIRLDVKYRSAQKTKSARNVV